MCKRILRSCSAEDWGRAVPLPRRSRTFGAPVDPLILQAHDARSQFGYESKEDAIRRLGWTRRKAILLRWVERQMRNILKPTERRSIRLYYFEGLSLREAARKLGKHPSTIMRANESAIEKLRAAAFRWWESRAWVSSAAASGRR